MAVGTEEHRLLYRVAQAYYLDGLTQQQIARRFGLSRPKVSRLLQKARDQGIVSITLVPPPHGLSDLEHDLEVAFDLKEAVIVQVSNPDDHATVVHELGPAAAECLLRCLSGSETIATAWGTSILAMVDALPYRSLPNATIVQMLGGLGPVDTLEHSAELTQRIAQKLGAKLRLLPAPGIVGSQAMAEALRADPQIASALALAARADIGLVGLGAPTPDSLLLRTGSILCSHDLQLLREAKAVGDVALRYLDAKGRPLDFELNERMIGLTLDQIGKIPRVIGIAGGPLKHDIIRAALRAKILDVLVTDLHTAQALLFEKD